MTARLLVLVAVIGVASVAHANTDADAIAAAAWRMSHDMWHRPPRTP